MFLIYQIIIITIIIISPIIFLYRIVKSKEDKIRFKEKLCFFSKIRGHGKLIWFHGSSVGEILSIFPLIHELEKNNSIKKILITSSTLSSSQIFKKFKFKKTIHQFFPIDSIFFSYKFLNYWKPSIAIFVESEIWPSIFQTLDKKKIPLLLLNARITRKTFQKWKRLKNFSVKIFGKIAIAYAQNLETFKYLKKLNTKKVKFIGNLKYVENKQIRKISLDQKLIKRFKDRDIWIASSTHLGEELLCSKAHVDLKKKHPKLLTIIIPRHIHRVDNIIKEINKLNLNVAKHSENKINLKNIDIYIVDAFGETQKFYKISKAVFLGGSLIKRGGQNPLEAVRHGANVLHGPNIDNFKEIYKLLKSLNISYQVNSLKSLVRTIDNFILFPNKKNNYTKLKIIGDKILNKTINEINYEIKNEIKKT
ncbi:3-deoxy-D-manno-octulosonic acid transferase [Candidatus Pelagibacter sp.]|jgi:3-deoxy-D-manno-octulosonic-acid transferase|nr:3-deoxy-D-manno-octulosonic acid transferase [Candidatus Pelagibacter sp.]